MDINEDILRIRLDDGEEREYEDGGYIDMAGENLLIQRPPLEPPDEDQLPLVIAAGNRDPPNEEPQHIFDDPDASDQLDTISKNADLDKIPNIKVHLRNYRRELRQLVPPEYIKTNRAVDSALTTIHELKKLAKELDTIPDQIYDSIHDIDVEYALLEEQLTYQSVIFNRVNDIKSKIHFFEDALHKARTSRNTRSLDFILSNDLPLPPHYFRPPRTPLITDALIEPTIRGGSTNFLFHNPELLQRPSSAPDVQNQPRSRQQSADESNPQPILSPDLPWETKVNSSKYWGTVLEAISKILKHNCTSISEGLDMIRNTLGIVLNPDDRFLLKDLHEITQQRQFLTNTLNEPQIRQATNKATPHSSYFTPCGISHAGNDSNQEFFSAEQNLEPRSALQLGATPKIKAPPTRRNILQEDEDWVPPRPSRLSSRASQLYENDNQESTNRLLRARKKIIDYNVNTFVPHAEHQITDLEPRGVQFQTPTLPSKRIQLQKRIPHNWNSMVKLPTDNVFENAPYHTATNYMQRNASGKHLQPRFPKSIPLLNTLLSKMTFDQILDQEITTPSGNNQAKINRQQEQSQQSNLAQSNTTNPTASNNDPMPAIQGTYTNPFTNPFHVNTQPEHTQQSNDAHNPFQHDPSNNQFQYNYMDPMQSNNISSTPFSNTAQPRQHLKLEQTPIPARNPIPSFEYETQGPIYNDHSRYPSFGPTQSTQHTGNHDTFTNVFGQPQPSTIQRQTMYNQANVGYTNQEDWSSHQGMHFHDSYGPTATHQYQDHGDNLMNNRTNDIINPDFSYFNNSDPLSLNQLSASNRAPPFNPQINFHGDNFHHPYQTPQRQTITSNPTQIGYSTHLPSPRNYQQHQSGTNAYTDYANPPFPAYSQPGTDYTSMLIYERESRELTNSNHTIMRHIRTLDNIETKNSQELTDILQNLKNVTRDLAGHDKCTTTFLKTIVHDKHKINQTSFSNFMNIIRSAENLSLKLRSRLDIADNTINEQRITITQMSVADSREVTYPTFSGEISLTHKHIFEFLTSLENNFKILKTPSNVQAHICRRQLEGSAALTIPETLVDYTAIKSILLKKFGNIWYILSAIMAFHIKIGKLPSQQCENPSWQRIESVAKDHISLIRKAEAILGNHPKAESSVLTSDTRNFQLLELLPHNLTTDLKRIVNHTDARAFYSMITTKFEDALSEATSNISNRQKSIKYKNDFDQDQIQLAIGYPQKYNDRNSFSIQPTLGTCPPQSCEVCSVLQADGQGERHFENHLLHGDNKRVYNNRCHLYLRMDMRSKNAFLDSHKWCKYCTRPKCDLGTERCKARNVLPTRNGNTRFFICKFPGCGHRIELCVEHSELNLQNREIEKRSYANYGLEYNVSLFCVIPALQTDCSVVNNTVPFVPFVPLGFPQEIEAQQTTPISINDTVMSNFERLDRPLLLDSRDEVIDRASTQAGLSARSIFMFAQLKGLTRPINCLFDSGGGSSLCIDNLPGRQLIAAQSNSSPVLLHGIGQGAKKGIPYTILLNSLDNSKTAIDCYAVGKILDPLSKLDLRQAHDYLKVNVKENTSINQDTRIEISKSKVCSFIQGNLDLLIGVKSLSIFPELVHSLTCGLSIFRLKLASHDPEIKYCLGGPWNAAEGIINLFPQSSALLSEFSSGLKTWHEPTLRFFTTELSLHRRKDNYLTESDLEEIDIHLDNQHNTDFILLANNEHKSEKGLQPFSPHNISDSMKTRFLEINHVVMLFAQHFEDCTDSNVQSTPRGRAEAILLKFRITAVLGNSEGAYSEGNITNYLLKSLEHLEKCIPESYKIKALSNTNPRPNFFIALTPNKAFLSQIIDLHQKIKTKFPHESEALINPNKSHITLLAFRIDQHQDTPEISSIIREALAEWYDFGGLDPTDNGSFSLSFLGLGNFDNKIIYLRPSTNATKLSLLNRCLCDAFTKHKIWHDSIFTPHLTLAKLDRHTTNKFSDRWETHFQSTFLGPAAFNQVQVYSMLDKESDGTNVCHENIKLESHNLTDDEIIFPEVLDVEMHEDWLNYEMQELQSSLGMTNLDIQSQKNNPLDICLKSTKNTKHINKQNVDEQNDEQLLSLTPDPTCSINDVQAQTKNTMPILNKHKSNESTALAKESKLAKELKFVFQERTNFRCQTCADCQTCKNQDNLYKTTPREIYETSIIESCVKYSANELCYITKLPLLENPQNTLAPNQHEVLGIYRKMTNVLSHEPTNKQAVIDSFNKLIELKYMVKMTDLDVNLQYKMKQKGLNMIPWNRVFKETSSTTPCRVVYNASQKTKTKRSLNSIIAKGSPVLNLMPLVINFFKDTNLLSLDLAKAFNSIRLHEDNYNLQCIYYNETLSTKVDPDIYVLVTMTYGLSSSSAILEHVMQDIASREKHNANFSTMISFFRFVDDAIFTSQDPSILDDLQQLTDNLFSKYGFKVKGYVRSSMKPPTNMSGGKDFIHALGYIYSPESDLVQINVPPLYFDGRKTRGQLSADEFTGGTFEELIHFVPKKLTLRVCASKSASIFDPAGLLAGWKLGVKHLLRLSMEEVKGEWDHELSAELREAWCTKFWEMIQLKAIKFKRCTFPLHEKYDRLDVVCFTDYGRLGRQQLFYLLKKSTSGKHHAQLILGRNGLCNGRSVPCQELESASDAAPVMSQICRYLGNSNVKITRKALIVDSTTICYWIAKDPGTLATYHRNRVNNILQNFTRDEIFHIRSGLQAADAGTKKIEGLNIVLPGGIHYNGPVELSNGLEHCEAQGIIKNIAAVILDPSNANRALDGIVYRNIPTFGAFLETNEPTKIQNNPDKQTSINEAITVFNQTYVSRVTERLQHHSYLVNPLNMPWPRAVRVMSILLNFIHKIIIKRLCSLTLSNTDKKALKARHARMFNCTWESANLHETFTFLAFTNSLHSSKKDADTGHNNSTKHSPTCPTQTVTLCPKHIHNDNNPISSMASTIKIDKLTNTPQNETASSQRTRQRVFKDLLCCYNNHNEHHTHSNLQVLASNDKADENNEPLKMSEMFSSIAELKSLRELAIIYFLKMGSAELRFFYTKGMLQKHTVMKNNIYYSRTRLFQGHQTENTLGEDLSKQELGIPLSVPCLDKYSPVAISILFYVHRQISMHRGADRTWYNCMPLIFVFQGQTLCADIVRSCFTCRGKLLQRVKDHFGPLGRVSLSFGSINRYIMCDLSGPFLVKTRIGARNLRGNSDKVKMWLLHSVCLTSYLNCIVPVETYGAQGFIDAFHRLSCRLGYPSLVFMDSSFAQIKALLDGQFTSHGLQLDLFTQTGIELKLSGVGPSSHSREGRVEKSIHAFQTYVKSRKVEMENLTPIQLDTICAQAACYLNCLPLATKHRNGTNISAQLVTPFSFLLGRRSNMRAPASYPELPDSRGDMLEHLQAASEGMYNFFSEQIPNLLLRPAKHKNMPATLKHGDLVLFPYTESKLGSEMKLGLITALEYDSDGEPRIIEVTYTLAQEQKLPLSQNDPTLPKTKKRFTRRGIHTLVKIYGISDENIDHSLSRIKQLIHDNKFILTNPTITESTEQLGELDIEQTNDFEKIFNDHQLTYLLDERPAKPHSK